VNAVTGIHIYAEFHFDDRLLQEEKQVHLFRIIQELVHNAIKHSGASHMAMRMEFKESTLVLTVEDNGKGFNSNQVFKQSTGLGLRNISSRVELLGGQIFLDSVPEKGTKYIIDIPV
jgi:signal transduction histidine kinase